ncbi:MAG: hypothetical protein ACPGO5_02080 [Patescibacteria group bacterium]
MSTKRGRGHHVKMYLTQVVRWFLEGNRLSSLRDGKITIKNGGGKYLDAEQAQEAFSVACQLLGIKDDAVPVRYPGIVRRITAIKAKDRKSAQKKRKVNFIKPVQVTRQKSDTKVEVTREKDRIQIKISKCNFYGYQALLNCRVNTNPKSAEEKPLVVNGKEVRGVKVLFYEIKTLGLRKKLAGKTDCFPTPHDVSNFLSNFYRTGLAERRPGSGKKSRGSYWVGMPVNADVVSTGEMKSKVGRKKGGLIRPKK